MPTPLHRYRVPILRSPVPALPPAPELLEHIVVHAANGVHAMLAARAVTGAFTALEPERLGDAPDRPDRVRTSAPAANDLPFAAARDLLAHAGIDLDIAHRLTAFDRGDAVGLTPARRAA
jgi:hypothetical protein